MRNLYFSQGDDAHEIIEMISRDIDWASDYLAGQVVGLLVPTEAGPVPQGWFSHTFDWNGKTLQLYWSFRLQCVGLNEM